MPWYDTPQRSDPRPCIWCSYGLGLSTAFSVSASPASETDSPSFTSAAARFRLAGVMGLSAPISSSFPQRPQFDRFVFHCSYCAMVTLWLEPAVRCAGAGAPAPDARPDTATTIRSESGFVIGPRKLSLCSWRLRHGRRLARGARSGGIVTGGGHDSFRHNTVSRGA